MIYFCFHDWTEWSEVSDTGYGYVKRQFRQCKKCKKVVSRKLRLGYETVSASTINKVVGEK